MLLEVKKIQIEVWKIFLSFLKGFLLLLPCQIISKLLFI